MYRHKDFQISENYSEHLYTGFLGFMMRYCHKTLENFSTSKKKFNKILEIGAGVQPHEKYIKHDYDEYHILETSDFAIDKLSKDKRFIIHKYDGKNLPFKEESFDRVVMSHTLEHIEGSENFIQEVMKIINPGGVLSISLPTDPGLIWRLARFINSFFKAKNVLGLTRLQYNYANATEHINSIFNLISIIRYRYKNSYEEYFYPMRFKSADLNFFYNVHIHKK